MPVAHCPSTPIGSVQPTDFAEYLQENRQNKFTYEDAQQVEEYQRLKGFMSWHQEMAKEWRDLYQKWLYSKWLEDAKTFIVACHRNSNNPRYEVLVERGETYLLCPKSPGGKRFEGFLIQFKCIQGSFGKNIHFLELFPDSYLLAPDDQPFL